MIGKKKEEWMKLCERAANERHPEKLMELVAEIDHLLEEKENRLKAANKVGPEPGRTNPTDADS
jgi:hypothetical protein